MACRVWWARGLVLIVAGFRVSGGGGRYWARSTLRWWGEKEKA